MIQESNCVATASSGSSIGLMQISSYNLCSSLGVNGASDVTGVANYDKNIQCGASILQQKYNTYSSGQTYACGTFSAPYSGWDAAERGYIGYGCTGNPNIDVTSYVGNIDSRYTALLNYINQNKASAPAASNPATPATPTTTLPLTQFNQYKSIFDKYSTPITTAYTSTSLSSPDFEALLVAIAQYCNWGGSSSDNLMCYQYGNSNYVGADKQVATVSAILKSVLTEDISSSSSYYSCISTTVMNDRLSCILSVYHTGTPNNPGFLGIGANTDGINYANTILTIWNDWKTGYFDTSGFAH